MLKDETKLKREIENAKTPKDKLLAKYELGKLYHDEGKYSQAIEIYKEIERSKDNPVSESQLLNALANSYYLLEDDDTSALLYEKVLSLNKEVIENGFTVADAALKLGIINYHKGNLEGALKYFKFSWKFQDCFDDEAKSFLHTHLGRCYYDLKDYAAAISHHKRSIELYEKLGRRDDWLYILYEELGWCYYCLEKYEEAIGIFRKIEDECPNFSKIYDVYRLIAFSLWNVKRYNETVRYLEQLLKMGPKEKDVAHFDYYIGTSYYLIGKYDKAKVHLTRFTKLGSSDEWMVEDAKKFLAKL